MRNNWFRKALVAVLTLALVAGAFAIAPKSAMAAGETITFPTNKTANVGDTVSLSTSLTGGDSALAPYTMVWSADPGLVLGGSSNVGSGADELVNGAVTFSAPTAGTYNVTMTCVDNGNNALGTQTIQVEVKAPVDLWGVQVSANASTFYVGDAITFSSSITGVQPSKKSYAWTLNGATFMKNVNGTTGNTVTGTAAAAGSVEATLSVTDTDTGTTKTSNTVTITIAKRPAALSFKETTGKAYAGATIGYNTLMNKLNATKGSDQKVVFHEGANTISEGTSYTIPSTASAGDTYVFTAEIPEGATYGSATSTNQYTVTVVAPAVVTLSSDKVILSAPGVSQQVTAYSNVDAGGLKLGEYDNTVAIASIVPDGNTKATITITAKKVGTVTIPVTNVNGDHTAYIKVIVGTPTPEIDAHYAGGITTLSKKEGHKSVDLHIKVENPLVNYVTVVRSNIRTYLKGYYSHPSTSKYTIALDANGEAIATIYPQYNGTCQYTVYAGDAVSSNPHITAYAEGSNIKKLTVTGFTTLPQTGPDYTWAYVLSGLCVAALGAAVTLNIKRKKNEQGI